VKASERNTVLHSVLEVETPFVRGVLPVGAVINQVRAIAGYGTAVELRIAADLTAEFGGEEQKWTKLGGIIRTDYFAYDVHWYEYNHIQYAIKLKGVRSI
jgi:hypothetical protein